MRLKAIILSLSVALILIGGNAFGTDIVTEVAKLLALDGAERDAFGFSVSIKGDMALVGAYGESANGTWSGSAYVFRWNGSSWVEEQKLLPSDGAENDNFGYSVSIDGDVALVGAWADDYGTNAGSAYVYRWNGSSWVEEQKLIPSDGAAYDNFGYSVSIDGDVALVGAENDRDNGLHSGSAYVFRWNGSSWVEEQKLLASDGNTDDHFGISVSINGDVALVGAHEDGSLGYAYVFRLRGKRWVEEMKLLASDGAAPDHFGFSVSMSGDVALVGAFRANAMGEGSGSAYVYRMRGKRWVEEQKLLPSDGAAGDYFGASVSISGDLALVGAYRNDDNGENSGSAYVYRWNGSSWVETQKLLPSDGARDDLFGRSVSINGDVAWVGAWRDDDNGENSGSVYIYLIQTTQPVDDIIAFINENDDIVGVGTGKKPSVPMKVRHLPLEKLV